MKRIFAAILSMSIMLTMICGCSNQKATEKETTTSTETKTETETKSELDYPTKPINWIVPAAAGAAIDIDTRKTLETLDLGANITVENIAGASQTIGTTEAASRPGDGYTLLTSAAACMLTQPILSAGQLGYEPTDFRHIAVLTNFVTSSICVAADSEIQTAEDLIEFLKTHDDFKYSANNTGSVSHIATAVALDKLGIDGGVFVPYNGSSEAMHALLSGEIDFMTADSHTAHTSQESGELKMLMVIHDQPYPFDTDVPLITDFGVAAEDVKDLVVTTYLSIHKDTPDEIVTYIKEKVNEVVYSEQYSQWLDDQGRGRLTEDYTEEVVTKSIEDATVLFSKVLKDLGMVK